jgi:dUTP pyrophosphatase
MKKSRIECTAHATDAANSNLKEPTGKMFKMIKFKKLNENATIPTRATLGSAGFDLSYCGDKDILLESGERYLFSTGVACAIPQGHCGQVWPRSGLALKYGIDVLAGMIDSDYRKEIGVILINHGGSACLIEPGDRIAQLIVAPFVGSSEWVNALDDSNRGGFGSSGR